MHCRIDEDILSSVYKQTRAGTKGKQELDKANVAVQELFTKVGEIKRKASESEQMVQEICRDIRDLDFAKRNLSTAIDALRKLHEAGQLHHQAECIWIRLIIVITCSDLLGTD